ncbi:SH2 domain-containing protein 3C-like isoform X3 [Centruroides sculpturatus]|uniref:SH2 domain-containing protein 3C-like isoform X3 n=1 Tax=Centruroides sculpturatus TaxID=218467 RepID=UPI000C6D5812|nr:SH2 domain-containing protein 3C-like isoform X3 [Centruroides sculpturatus]
MTGTIAAGAFCSERHHLLGHKLKIKMAHSGPHLEISTWLKNLDLPQYSSKFHNYKGVEDILHFSERDLKSLGIKNGSHRARIMSSLVILREKFKKGFKMKIEIGYPNRSASCINLTVPNNRSSPEQRSWPNSYQGSRMSSGKSSNRSSMEPFAGPNASASELKAALEWELSLDSNDVRSHAWYHGTIPRQRAEELVAQDGDFLIRDCMSKPGDYVLTCRWSGSALHFIINKVVLQPFTIYEKIQYRFEKESFDTLQDLVTYYVGSKQVIFSSSSISISRPINRNMPLTYYLSRYGLDCQMQYVARALEKNQDISSSRYIPSNSSPVVIKKDIKPPELPQKKRELFPNQQEQDKPPPKPSRVPSKKYTEKPKISVRRLPSLDDDDDDDDFAELPPYEKIEEQNIQNSRKSSGVTRHSFLDRKIVDDDYNKSKQFIISSLNLPSSINLNLYKTPLLASENKPLDSQAISKVRTMLLEYGPRLLAVHLTKVDLEMLKCGKEEDLGFGVVSGLELMLLPQGKQLRKDILERIECLKLFVTITCLLCGSQQEIIEMINKWIKIAIETKVTIGNLYGFACIMQGLAHPQLTRLQNVWLLLRQTYTETALTYETKLRPALKSIQESSSFHIQNICIPYIITLVSVFDRIRDINSESEIVEILDSPGEMSTVDYGLEMLLNHLTIGRQISQQSSSFSRNGESILNINHEPLLLDIFRTEFHLKVLWGSKAANVDPVQRYEKFEQLLAIVSNRIEHR